MTAGAELRRFRLAAGVTAAELAEQYGGRGVLTLETRELVGPGAVRRYCADVLAVFDRKAGRPVYVRGRWEVPLAYIAGGGDPANVSHVEYDQRAQLRAEIYMAQLRLERARAGAGQDGPDERIAAQTLATLEELARKWGLEPYAGGVEFAG